MALRTKRVYKLKLGVPIELGEDFFTPLQKPSDKLIELENYYDENNKQGYLITEHDLSYKAVFSEGAKKNTIQITLKNLHPDTINYVMVNRGKNLYVEFDVGYDNTIKNLFKGTITEASLVKQSSGTRLRIDIADGTINSAAHTSRSYPKGTDFNKIVDDLRKDLALPIGRVVPLPENTLTPAALSVFGNTCEKLEALMSQFDYIFSISGGLCYTVPKKEMLSENAAYITHDTGLLGNVQELIVRGKGNKQTDADTTKAERIRFSCQTDASIKPPLSVYVEDEESGYKGIYKVEKAVFTCSGFETGSYVVTVDCIKNDLLVKKEI